MVLSFLFLRVRAYILNTVLTHPGKSRKVMGLKEGIFQACKVMENDYGHEKVWKRHGIPLIGHGIF